MRSTYTHDDLMKCDPLPGCQGCEWRPIAESVCSGNCIGPHNICPWLLVCRCLNPDMSPSRGHQLERLVMQQPPPIQVASVSIPKRWIRLGEYEIRQKRDEETIRQIAASILDNGLFSPPGGVVTPSGHIDIIMGSNRTLAVTSLLNWDAVPVRIFHWWGNDVWERKIAAFQENMLRQQMSFDEEVALVYSYWRQTGLTVREIATHFRMSKSWVQERITWGKRLYKNGEVPHKDSIPLNLSKVRRRQVGRITLPKDEVSEWLVQLGELGVVPKNGNGHNNGSLREDLRQTMEALTHPSRITLHKSEVEEWLSRTSDLGIVLKNGHSRGNGNGNGGLLEDLRQVMDALIVRLEEEKVA